MVCLYLLSKFHFNCVEKEIIFLHELIIFIFFINLPPLNILIGYYSNIYFPFDIFPPKRLGGKWAFF